MPVGLDAIHEELKRLQADGVDRVFVSEAAMEALRRLQQSAAPIAPEQESKPEPAPRTKESLPAGVAPLPKPPVVELPQGSAEEQLAWLRDLVENQSACKEHVRKGCKVVFGVGGINADIFFCGEAPGADEEKAGEPFVGKAGQLLTKIIQAMGLSRETVYIGNILKWRPEHDRPSGNRPPTEEEMAYCLPFLRAQLEIVKPKVIVALGNTAVTGLLGPDPNRRMGKVRGTWDEFNGTPLMITFHPSYLLRNDTNATKRLVWEDMLEVMEKVGLPISEKQQNYFL